MVYMAVQEIPYGKVTTYGHIARLIGERKLILLVIRHGHVRFRSTLNDTTLDATDTRGSECFHSSATKVCRSEGHVIDKMGTQALSSSKWLTSVCHRQVGQALKYLPPPLDADGNSNTFHNNNVPWQRVISSAGIISQR